MNRGIDNGKNIDPQLLAVCSHATDVMCITLDSQYLYDNIKASPFKIPDDDDTNASIAFFNPERDGWLTKEGLARLMSCCSIVHGVLEGGTHKSWKKRWFTLCHNCLYYFESSEVRRMRPHCIRQ